MQLCDLDVVDKSLPFHVIITAGSESWYFPASAGNGGREISPSSAFVRWIAREGEGSGEKRQLAYGSTKSPMSGRRTKSSAGDEIPHLSK